MLRSLIQTAVLLPLLAFGLQAATCLTTLPTNPPFTPPSPWNEYAMGAGWFWHGNDALWTSLQVGGTWKGLPKNNRGYREKVFWWSEAFSPEEETQPQLVVTARRLDEDAPSVAVARATQWPLAPGTAIVVALDFPTHGCWEITGHYRGQSLTFVVSVQP